MKVKLDNPRSYAPVCKGKSKSYVNIPQRQLGFLFPSNMLPIILSPSSGFSPFSYFSQPVSFYSPANALLIFFLPYSLFLVSPLTSPASIISLPCSRHSGRESSGFHVPPPEIGTRWEASVVPQFSKSLSNIYRDPPTGKLRIKPFLISP